MLRPTEFTAYSLHFDGSEIIPEETEFLLAMLAYQKRFRRRYPTWREVLNMRTAWVTAKSRMRRSSTSHNRRRPNQRPIDLENRQ